MLRLNKNLQTVKLKYILITLFLRRAFSRLFIIIFKFRKLIKYNVTT